MASQLTRLAKTLRKQGTDAETVLWRSLRARQMEGVKFRRQQPVDNFIVDFVSFEKRIVVELDGGQHNLGSAKDQKRDSVLDQKGFRVLRFWNSEVFGNLEGVLEVIRRACLC